MHYNSFLTLYYMHLAPHLMYVGHINAVVASGLGYSKYPNVNLGCSGLDRN